MRLDCLKTLDLHLDYSRICEVRFQPRVVPPRAFSRTDLAAFFEALLVLETLKLDWTFYLDLEEDAISFSPFLQALSIPSSSTNQLPCPKLSTLELESTSIDFEDLTYFLRLRTGAKNTVACRVTLDQCFGFQNIRQVCYEELSEALTTLEIIQMPLVRNLPNVI